MKQKNPKTTSKKAVLERTKNSRIFWEKYLLILFTIASFLVPFVIGSYALHTKTQLELMDGMAEEYETLGLILHYNGKYELEEKMTFI